MKAGDLLNLTDGNGNLQTCKITDDHKKRCSVSVQSKTQNPKPKISVIIAISLLKTTTRFEWFLEKATEIGITNIIPLVCERTEKEKFRVERLQGILISAMLQSQQVWLPILHAPIVYEALFSLEEVTTASHKFIAHCSNHNTKQSISGHPGFPFPHPVILIGPEGDFTTKEIERAIQNGFIPVTLGDTRLRTETAGVVAASLLKSG